MQTNWNYEHNAMIFSKEINTNSKLIGGQILEHPSQIKEIKSKRRNCLSSNPIFLVENIICGKMKGLSIAWRKVRKQPFLEKTTSMSNGS